MAKAKVHKDTVKKKKIFFKIFARVSHEAKLLINRNILFVLKINLFTIVCVLEMGKDDIYFK